MAKKRTKEVDKTFIFFSVQFLYLSEGFYEMESGVCMWFPALCLKGDGFVKMILTVHLLL